jgi:hypothetical protein
MRVFPVVWLDSLYNILCQMTMELLLWWGLADHGSTRSEGDRQKRGEMGWGQAGHRVT